MRYIIYGAGGIGCTIGGHLYRQDQDVILVGNSEHMDAINSNGLTFATGDGNYNLKIPACKTAEELVPFQPDDVVLLCAKSQHTIRCLGQLKKAGAPNTLPILCCQNSIWNEPAATRIFDRVYGVLIVVPAVFLNPGEVVNPISRRAGFIEIGCFPKGKDTLCDTIAADLQKAGFTSNPNPEVMKSKGTKCLGNLGNSLLAITGGKGNAGAFLDEVRQEAQNVWNAAGIEWEDQETQNQRKKAGYGDNILPEGYEDLESHGSSWQSLARGTGNIEAEQLNGDVVQLGRLLGINTPYNELLWRLAEEMASKAEGPGLYTLEDLAKMVAR